MSSAEPTEPAQPADLPRPVLIGIPIYGRLELLQRAICSIDRCTPVEVELVLIDDCGPQRPTEPMIAGWLPSGRSWRLISHQTNLGFVGSVNELFELAAGRDVIVVNSDVEVLPGWFDGLRSAIASNGRAATASSMASEGGLLSITGLTGQSEPALAAVREELPVAAEIPVAVAHCTWFTRPALAAVGPFDRRFDPGYGEEVDWSLRAAREGLVHLAALHSFVLHAGSASFGRSGRFWSLSRRHELRLLVRYPVRWWQLRRFAADPDTALALGVRRICQILGAA